MKSTEDQPIAHLLLAAGASTRMGLAKQLLSWKGQSLIRHAISTIREAGVSAKLLVVVGANREMIIPELNDLSVEIVVNPDWDEGMGSSIRSGLQFLLEKDPDRWGGVCISLVDQPLIKARHFQTLYQLWQESDQPIAAARYNDILGVPAIFDQSTFPKLLALEGTVGARKILQQAQAQAAVADMELPEATFDLDTPEDYERLVE